MQKTITLREPKFVQKSWGREVHIHNDDGYCAKLLEFNSCAYGSLHYHLEKTETWYVQSGRFTLITIDPATAERYTATVHPGQVVHIPAGAIHQLVAHEPVVIFETSTYDDPNDTYRVEKSK